MKAFRKCRTRVGELDFSFVRWGNRTQPVMVLLHGMTGHTRMWDTFAGSMASEYEVIALDQRGHGDTDWACPPAYATSDFVGDLRGVTASLGIDRMDLIGLSLGAHVALAFSIEHPDVVDRLVSIDVPPTIRMFRGSTQTADDPEAWFEGPEEAVDSVRDVYPLASDAILEHRVRHNLRLRPGGGWTWKHSPDVAHHWQPDDLTNEIRRIQCPTLVVRGGESNILDAQTASFMAAAIPLGELVTVEGAGHSVPMDRPKEFERAVREFLET